MTAVIVCGSRTWTDRQMVESKLDELEMTTPGLLIIEGANPRGADAIAGAWARRAQQRGVRWVSMPAEWKFHAASWCPGAWCALKNFCLGAGPRRNQAMLERALQEEAQLVVAFKDEFNLAGRKGGTEDMVRRARDVGVHGVIVRHPRSGAS